MNIVGLPGDIGSTLNRQPIALDLRENILHSISNTFTHGYVEFCLVSVELVISVDSCDRLIHISHSGFI